MAGRFWLLGSAAVMASAAMMASANAGPVGTNALLGADMSDRVLAAPLSKTTLKFSCDRGVGTATVVAQIQVSLFDPTPVGGPQTLSCGPDSISGGRSDSIRR